MELLITLLHRKQSSRGQAHCQRSHGLERQMGHWMQTGRRCCYRESRREEWRERTQWKRKIRWGFCLGDGHLSDRPIPGLQSSNGKDTGIGSGGGGLLMGTWVEGHSAFWLNSQAVSLWSEAPILSVCFPFPEPAIRNPIFSSISAKCQEENNLISWLKWFPLRCHHLTFLGAHSLK